MGVIVGRDELRWRSSLKELVACSARLPDSDSMPTVTVESGEGGEFEVSAVVRAVLASTQNEVTLPGALQARAVSISDKSGRNRSFPAVTLRGHALCSSLLEPWLRFTIPAWPTECRLRGL